MKPETRQEMVNQLRKERGDRPLHSALIPQNNMGSQEKGEIPRKMW